jgi:hypothetical protein
MRTFVLSTLFAAGAAMSLVGGASAATIGGSLDKAAQNFSPVEKVVLVCRRIEVCHPTPMGRRCRIERVCRERW